MKHSRVVELGFFYLALAGAVYFAWLLLNPFFAPLVVAGMVVIAMYPLHALMTGFVFRRSPTMAALVSTLLTYCFVIGPLSLLLYLLTKETIAFYSQLQTTSPLMFSSYFDSAQEYWKLYFPRSEGIAVADIIKTVSGWGATQLQTIFSNAISFFFSLFISIMATFFFFRDGKKLSTWLILHSPLADDQDTLILERIYTAVRSVLAGIVVVSLLQGIVAGIGFWLFGVPNAILWGAVAAFGGLIPGLGTPIIMIPAVLYLWLTGSTFAAGGLLVYAAVSIVVIDNIVSPSLMSRGSALHPLLILLSILGGISLLGVIGVIIGPVVLSIVLVLLELQKKLFIAEQVTPAPKKAKKRTPKKL